MRGSDPWSDQHERPGILQARLAEFRRIQGAQTYAHIHDSGRLFPATIAPLPAAIDFSNLRRDSLDFLSDISAPLLILNLNISYH